MIRRRPSGHPRRLWRRLGVGVLSIFGLLSIIATNGGDGLGPSPPVDEALGGVWGGLVNGVEIFALSTDGGQFRWMTMSNGEQGFGAGSVSVGVVTLNYTQVAPLSGTLPDGSTSATCSGSGIIEQRQTISATLACSTSLGLDFTTTMSLFYNASYERDSSLAVVAGNYDDGGLVLTVDSGGMIFEQDPFTGCVVNGQVNVLDPQINIYDVSMMYSNCLGDQVDLNGVTFVGLGTLDDAGFLPQLIIGVTGEVGGVTFGKGFTLLRI